MDGSKSLNTPWTGCLRRTRHLIVANSGRLRFSYFRTTEQNRPGFVQVCRSKNLKLPFNTLIFTGSLLTGKYA
jgi:hypothetical protein